MNREEQKQLGVAKVRFLRPLLGLRVRDRHNNVDIRKANEIRTVYLMGLGATNNTGFNT